MGFPPCGREEATERGYHDCLCIDYSELAKLLLPRLLGSLEDQRTLHQERLRIYGVVLAKIRVACGNLDSVRLLGQFF